MGYCLRIIIGNLLLKRLLLSITQAIQTHNHFVILTENLKSEIPEELTAMRQALEAWEADQSQPDPYRLPKSNVILAQVRLAMAEELVGQGTSAELLPCTAGRIPRQAAIQRPSPPSDFWLCMLCQAQIKIREHEFRTSS